MEVYAGHGLYQTEALVIALSMAIIVVRIRTSSCSTSPKAVKLKVKKSSHMFNFVLSILHFGKKMLASIEETQCDAYVPFLF